MRAATIQTPLNSRAEVPEPPTLFRIIEEPSGGYGVELGFHPGQVRAWDSTARFVFMIAGSQSGKTAFGPWWLYREICWRGPGDYIAATSTYDLFKLKMLPTILDVFVNVLGIARYWAGIQLLELCIHEYDRAADTWAPRRGEYLASNASDPMWARVILRSASSEGGLESATAKAAWLDECGQDEFTLDAWEAVLRRLSLTRGRVLGTTTPYNLGWLKQKIYDAWKAGDPDIDVIQFASIVNPAFPLEEFEARRARMDDWKFRMFYRGEFDRPAGLIYSAFIDQYRDEGGHKVKPFDLPRHWPRWVGVDPGAVHQAVVWLAHDIDSDVFYVYRESLQGGKSTAEHAGEARRLAERNGEQVVLYLVGNKSEVQQRLDWQAAGVANVAPPPVWDVESGIDSIIRLFKEHRLFVFDTCAGLLDELGSYRRELDEAGEPTERIHQKDRFHRLDALRYAAVGVTHAPAITVGRIAMRRR